MFYLMRVLTLLLPLLVWTGQTSTRSQEPPVVRPAAIAPRLAADLTAASEPISFLVIMKEQADPNDWETATRHADTGTTGRGAQLYATLTSLAGRSQRPLLAWLEAQHVVYRTFYIVNMVEVRGDAALAATLSRRSDVDRLTANPPLSMALPSMDPGSTPIPEHPVQAGDAASIPYGLAYTHADQVWAMGYQGQGIVVASQDSGVAWQHPALQTSYRGWDAETLGINHVYNWFDYWGSQGRPNTCDMNPQVPCDDNGHGTHTVGTMVGSDPMTGGAYAVVGMAPQARWIGCRNMRLEVGTPTSYAACFQFFLAPYPQGGDPMVDGRPQLAPHIINNSWACPEQEGCDASSLRQVVQVARAAGQMVVAAAGNYGPRCATVQAPIGMHDAVFTVGAHDSSGAIAPFSSRGPVFGDRSNRLKPDLTAPGIAVYSTYPPNDYKLVSGTSMASPHVAGAVALLWSAQPSLIGQIDLTEQILYKSAGPMPDSQCDVGSMTSPNNVYGYGHLDAYAAVLMARDPATVTVTVQGATGAPMPETVVTLSDVETGYVRSAAADAGGETTFAPLYTGRYTVTAPATEYPLFPQVSLQVNQGTLLTVTLKALGGQLLPFLRLDGSTGAEAAPMAPAAPGEKETR